MRPFPATNAVRELFKKECNNFTGHFKNSCTSYEIISECVTANEDIIFSNHQSREIMFEKMATDWNNFGKKQTI